MCLINWKCLKFTLTRIRESIHGLSFFDFQSILLKRNESAGEKLTKTQEHVHITVAVCSNVQQYEKAKAFINEIPSKLTGEMLNYMTKI